MSDIPLTAGAPESKEYTIQSNPIFLVIKRKPDGSLDPSQKEILVLDADMKIFAEKPALTLGGEEMISLKVEEWVAKGKSKLLGDQEITFRTTRDLRSSVKSFRQAGHFFPGELSLEIEYKVEVAGVTAAETGERLGTAKGTITDMPPKPTDIFELDKSKGGQPLNIAGFDVVPIACAC